MDINKSGTFNSTARLLEINGSPIESQFLKRSFSIPFIVRRSATKFKGYTMKILGNIHKLKTIGVACSGGPDSMAALDFFNYKDRNVTAFFFHHAIKEDNAGFECLQEYAENNNIIVKYKVIDTPYSKLMNVSKEAYWREERYKWLNSFNIPIITGHHLDDVAETWVFSALHGTPKIIPFNTNNIYRPFLTVRKTQLIKWCKKHSIRYDDDVLNTVLTHPRNKIRHQLMPYVMQINPGLHKMLKKRVEQKINDDVAL